MKQFNTILFALFLLLYACKEEEIISKGNPYVPNNQQAGYLWQVPLDVDTVSAASINPVLYNNQIMFSSERPFDAPVHVYMIDTADQHIVWQTSAFFNNDCPSISMSWGGRGYMHENLFATLCGGSPRVFDLNIGNVLWDHDISTGDANLTGWNSLLFHSEINGANPYTRSTIMMSDISFNSWDTVYSLPMENGYSSHLYPPSVMLNANNDTLLFFQNRQWTLDSIYDGKVDLYGYNLSADSVIWEQDDIDIHGNSSIYPPLVYQDKIYFKGTFTIYCLHAETGEIIWSWLPDAAAGDVMMSNLIVEENKLLVKTSGDYFYALSPETGNVLWLNNNCGNSPFSLTYFDGVAYYISGNDSKLHAININDGTELWSMTSPNSYINAGSNAYFVNSVAIDALTRRLYVADKYFLMCFQLN
ncbi:MAG: PQQ-binding-like beta-propeller repeat protein [Bacteroidetes bacterium]|nr:PQQ-binding-like beta-propeller repeat protein [Bacteroidota bacterium]